ncbi:glycosyltransferase family 2 protein [Neptunicoccus sediminis]|uniref:glycosyltransferase family 2 protein n=1 Tax=Neptunicoccus sediminis TaxID=1892596 RepID=UPI0012FF67F7|nr:glycosyltransferase family 2 protein [Neptunicoccus sediminis]
MPNRKYAAVTMVRDENLMLKIWYQYYSAQFGDDNLYIFDHNSSSAPVRSVLPGAKNVFRIPTDNPVSDPTGMLRKFDNYRFKFLSSQIASLLVYYDCIIVNDVDEIFVVDPRESSSLRDYLNSKQELKLTCGMGLEVIQDLNVEIAYDPEKPIFEQRKLFRYNLNFCKPWVVGKEVEITGHGAFSPFEIDPNLLLMHLHWVDYDTAHLRQSKRRDFYRDGRGGLKSKWNDTQDTKDQEWRDLLKLNISSRDMPHYDFLENLFPNYRQKVFSPATYKRQSGRRHKLIEIPKFVTNAQRNAVKNELHKFPSRFSDAAI